MSYAGLATQRAANSAEYERIQSRPITAAVMARETGEESAETSPAGGVMVGSYRVGMHAGRSVPAKRLCESRRA